MGHRLIGDLGGGIDRQRMGHALFDRKGQGAVGPEGRTGRGEDEVFRLHRPGTFEHGQKADDVGVDIALGVFEAVADPGLGPEVDDAARGVGGEQGGHARAVGEIEGVVAIARFGQQAVEPRLFQGRVVIVVEVVDADHRLPAGQQAAGGVEADEAGRSGDEDGALGGHGFAIAPGGRLRHLISRAAVRCGRTEGRGRRGRRRRY